MFIKPHVFSEGSTIPKGEFRQTKKIFYSEDEINKWYKAMRSRVDGLSIVLSVKEAQEKPLEEVNKEDA
jgi:hypothetical protein